MHLKTTQLLQPAAMACLQQVCQ